MQIVLNNGYKYYMLAQSQDIFYTYQFPLIVDYCTKYEQYQPILFCQIATNIKFKTTIAILVLVIC